MKPKKNERDVDDRTLVSAWKEDGKIDKCLILKKLDEIRDNDLPDDLIVWIFKNINDSSVMDAFLKRKPFSKVMLDCLLLDYVIENDKDQLIDARNISFFVREGTGMTRTRRGFNVNPFLAHVRDQGIDGVEIEEKEDE